MARYIDADKLLESMLAKFKCVPLVGVSKYIFGEECFEGEHFDTLINEQPTADVVEVVRCKDCVDYIPDAELDHEQLPNDLEADGYCDNWLKYTDETNFCSSGRRTDNDL